MGGDPFTHPTSLTEEESSLGQYFPHRSMESTFSSGYGEDLNTEPEKDSDSVVSGLSFGKFQGFSILEVEERQRCKIYDQVLRSYEQSQSGIERLEKAKKNVLSYKPGSLVENAGGLSSFALDVPETTSLLLIGPKGSGKSSLVNKISRVLENDVFDSQRAQVSFNPSNGDGTYFLHEYRIPRVGGSFCLFDTRGISEEDPFENMIMITDWMANGVRHGQLVNRKSDSIQLKTRLSCKARQSCPNARVRPVNFVIFVVNGISVLESMNSDDETKQRYSQLIATTFNEPFLSFRDDKPVVAVTHGDLLSISDRVKIRVYLGELLGIPPTSQIFDIPENDDPVTKLAIFDMLNYSFGRSDRNLPMKCNKYKYKYNMDQVYVVRNLLLAMILVIFSMYIPQPRARTDPMVKIDWPKIRHLWLG